MISASWDSASEARYSASDTFFSSSFRHLPSKFCTPAKKQPSTKKRVRERGEERERERERVRESVCERERERGRERARARASERQGDTVSVFLSRCQCGTRPQTPSSHAPSATCPRSYAHQGRRGVSVSIQTANAVSVCLFKLSGIRVTSRHPVSGFQRSGIRSCLRSSAHQERRGVSVSTGASHLQENAHPPKNPL